MPWLVVLTRSAAPSMLSSAVVLVVPDPVEVPPLRELMPGRVKFLVGLANDEIGYIIPRRQWDERPPYAYGRSSGQYGEINSCGPQVAPLIMQQFQKRFAELMPAGK